MLNELLIFKWQVVRWVIGRVWEQKENNERGRAQSAVAVHPQHGRLKSPDGKTIETSATGSRRAFFTQILRARAKKYVHVHFYIQGRVANTKRISNEDTK